MCDKVLNCDFTSANTSKIFFLLKVCSEEIMTEILARYLRYNAHAASYTWKYDGRNLDMDKTLEENGIPDEDEEFYKLSMNDDTFLQAMHLYFNDDLTEA
jgi:hypothetical protein